jgi:hypothetical protein
VGMCLVGLGASRVYVRAVWAGSTRGCQSVSQSVSSRSPALTTARVARVRPVRSARCVRPCVSSGRGPYRPVVHARTPPRPVPPCRTSTGPRRRGARETRDRFTVAIIGSCLLADRCTWRAGWCRSRGRPRLGRHCTESLGELVDGLVNHLSVLAFQHISYDSLRLSSSGGIRKLK